MFKLEENTPFQVSILDLVYYDQQLTRGILPSDIDTAPIRQTSRSPFYSGLQQLVYLGFENLRNPALEDSLMQTCMHMPGYPYYSHLLDFCFPKNFKPTTEERGTINSWLLALDQLRSYQTCSVENLFEYKTPVGTPLDTTNYNIYPPHYLKLFFSDEEFQNYVAIMPLFMPMMFYGPKGSDNLRTVFATPIAYQHTFRTDLLFYLQTQAFYSFVEQSGSETTALKKWENSDTLDAPIDIFCEPDMRNARHMLLLPELNQNNGFVKYMVLPTNENRPIIKQRFKNAVKASIGMKKNKSSNKNRAI